jgi:hypothetical protein
MFFRGIELVWNLAVRFFGSAFVFLALVSALITGIECLHYNKANADKRQAKPGKEKQ